MDEDGAGTAIAEAACRHSPQTSCDLFSFAPSRFNQSPLRVTWFRNAGGQVDVDLGNYWELSTLSAYLTQLTPIKNWDGLHNWAKTECSNLLFSDDVIEPIQAMPFSYAATQQLQMLLLILNDLSDSHDETSGALNANGLKILANSLYYATPGGFLTKPRMQSLILKHPTTTKILCPVFLASEKWRIRSHYRIHFQWPKPKDFPLWIAYIGPKLTRG